MKILLDYVFPISIIQPTPAASTAFLKQVCVIAKPKAGQEANVGLLYPCTNMTEVGVRTANTNAQQLFNAGMSKVFIILSTDLDLVGYLEAHRGEFFTVLISSDYTNADIADMDVEGFEGVTGIATADSAVAEAQAVIENRCAFKVAAQATPTNMFNAFGKLLSNQSNWLNNQYISMPVNDQVSDLGSANSLFDERVSFVINDEEFGNRLALFAAGGKAIVAPYIIKNLRINLQSRTLQWISQNQPQYTLKDAALLETRLEEDVIQNFIDRQWIESGNISITLREQNFVANGAINVPEPKALWRVFGELTQTI